MVYVKGHSIEPGLKLVLRSFFFHFLLTGCYLAYGISLARSLAHRIFQLIMARNIAGPMDQSILGADLSPATPVGLTAADDPIPTPNLPLFQAVVHEHDRWNRWTKPTLFSVKFEIVGFLGGWSKDET